MPHRSLEQPPLLLDVGVDGRQARHVDAPRTRDRERAGEIAGEQGREVGGRLGAGVAAVVEQLAAEQEHAMLGLAGVVDHVLAAHELRVRLAEL